MDRAGQIAPMPKYVRILLYRALCNAAKVRLRIIEAKQQKDEGDIELYEEASKMLRNAPVYTNDEQTAREFLSKRRDLIERVFPPTHLKKLDRMLLCA